MKNVKSAAVIDFDAHLQRKGIDMPEGSRGKAKPEPSQSVLAADEVRHHKLIDLLVQTGVGLGVMFIAWMAFTVYTTSLEVAKMSKLVEFIPSIDARLNGMVTKEELERELGKLRSMVAVEREDRKALEAKILVIEDRIRDFDQDHVVVPTVKKGK